MDIPYSIETYKERYFSLENTTFRGLNYKIWLIFLTFFLISALAFIKPITGNPIVYNLCSKAISNGLGPKIFFYGYSQPFFCNFHTTLEMHALSFFYSLFKPSALVSKAFNFSLLLLFFIIFFKKKYRTTFLIETFALWLSIPLILNSFQVTDPDSNLSLLILPLIFLHLRTYNSSNLNFYFLFSMLFVLFWTKEITAFITSLILIISLAFEGNKIFFKTIFAAAMAFFLFLATYFFYCNYYDLPFLLLFNTSISLVSQSLDLNSIFYKLAIGIKGLSIWLGPVFLATFFALLFKALKLKYFMRITQAPYLIFSILCFLVSILMVLISGSFYPRYIIPFIFPAIVIFYSQLSNYSNAYKSLLSSKLEIFVFAIILVFWIFGSGDVVSKSNALHVGAPFFLYKIFLIFSPLFFLISHNLIKGNQFLFINKKLYFLFGVIPSLVMSFSIAAAPWQNSTQIQGLKGFNQMIDFIKINSNSNTIVFGDHIDLAFYLDNKFVHLFNATNDIPVSSSKGYEVNNAVYNSIENKNYFISLRSFDEKAVIAIESKVSLPADSCRKNIGSFILIHPCSIK